MTTTTSITTKLIFRTIARFTRKAIKFVFKTLLVLLIVAIVLPIGYFAWRAGQPMESPQFNGLSFYQYNTWRFETHNEVAAQYQTAHPNVKVKNCNIIDPIPFVIFAPWSEFYALAGKFPALRRVINPRDYKYIPADATWATLPAAWWTTYESMILPLIRDDHANPVVYCRLPQYPPTPEEWKQSH